MVFSLSRILQLRGGRLGLFVVVDVLGHLPDLHYVVLGHRADHPRFVGVPREVGYLGRMSSVDELRCHEKILIQHFEADNNIKLITVALFYVLTFKKPCWSR